MHQPTTAAEPHPLRSVHTQTLTQLLNNFGLSLGITTYQAGKLIIARADGDVVNTHFRLFDEPMGLAVRPDRIALGVTGQIHRFHNVPALAAKLTPPQRHDACYLPRSTHDTGDVDVHEMAWAGDDIWFVNTRFSCLCTLDQDYSFVPQWRPPFISAYDMRDRCHLNGLAVRDGQPRYVTALARTDEPAGWRRYKADGGILMDLHGDRVLLGRLSMPHSPRWYRDRLWFLESGRGSLAYLDPAKDRAVTVAELPGFTRGLDFVGDYAVIGLSQVRESAVFAGLPLTSTQPVRHCGVWVVDIRNGDIVAFLRFEEGVREIFAVSAIPWHYPELDPDEKALARGAYVLPDAALAEAVQPPKDWESADHHFEQGNRLYNDGKTQEALAAYTKALALQADHVPARFNLGLVLGNLDRLDEAVTELKAVIAADAGHADAYNSLGFIEAERGHHGAATEYFRQAIAIAPSHGQAHQNLGLTLLRTGDYTQGFQELQWRWQGPGASPFEPPRPRWDGQPEPEKTLLVQAEEQLGDCIQLARFISWAAQRVSRLLLSAPAQTHELLGAMPGVADIRDMDATALPAFDLWTPMISLPLLYGLTPSRIPAPRAYLRAPSRQGLTLPSEGRRRVGLCWGGSSAHGRDRNRSTRLLDWLPVLSRADVRFFSLQKGGAAEAQLAEIPEASRPLDLAPSITNWGDTAALIEQLDLVITLDTGVAHLAGALGKPVWTLLHTGADWRYPEQGDAMAWFPTMRLFRQTTRAAWEPVMAQVAEALAAWDAAHTRAP